jgi:hypothetical protein
MSEATTVKPDGQEDGGAGHKHYELDTGTMNSALI